MTSCHATSVHVFTSLEDPGELEIWHSPFDILICRVVAVFRAQPCDSELGLSQPARIGRTVLVPQIPEPRRCAYGATWRDSFKLSRPSERLSAFSSSTTATVHHRPGQRGCCKPSCESRLSWHRCRCGGRRPPAFRQFHRRQYSGRRSGAVSRRVARWLARREAPGIEDHALTHAGARADREVIARHG